jgi:ribosomal protein S27AE
MRKPTTRKERIEFLINKQGYTVASSLLTVTDREVKKYFDMFYKHLKDKEDVKEKRVTCMRCGAEVEHHFECNCGYDRAVFSEEDWIEDIQSFTDDDLPQGIDTINDEFKLKHNL